MSIRWRVLVPLWRAALIVWRFCGALECGGLTPSFGLVRAIQDQVPLPLMVMIRPRGGDFCYDAAELATMERDALIFREADVAGLVFGCLQADGRLDEPAVCRLMAAAQPMAVTFHRAVDVAVDVMFSVDQLARLGVDRILTSGQAATAVEGVPVLKQMIDVADGRLVIMPGGGILRVQRAPHLPRDPGPRDPLRSKYVANSGPGQSGRTVALLIG